MGLSGPNVLLRRFRRKGARFRGKWGLSPPPPRPLAPAPPFSWGAVGVLLKIAGGGVFQERGGGRAGGGPGVGGRGRRGPIYRENEPHFRRKRLYLSFSGSNLGEFDRIKTLHFQGNTQKNPRVRKNFCPQFWGRKWLRQFYGHLEICVLSAGNRHVHKIQRFRGGGGYFGFFFGEGECRFYFYGREDFSEIPSAARWLPKQFDKTFLCNCPGLLQDFPVEPRK